MQVDHRLPHDALNARCGVLADIGIDAELVPVDYQAADDLEFDCSGVDIGGRHGQVEAQIAAPDFFDAAHFLEINIRHGERLHQRHCTALHGLPPIGKDPNVDECAHFQALVATDSLAGAVHQASVVHRHAYIMVNGVLS